MHTPSPIRRATALASTLLAMAGTADARWCGDRCDQVVIDWNAETHQLIKADSGYADPMAASRVLAMVHLAMHDAANAVQPRYARYAAADKGEAAATPAARTPAKAAAAARDAAREAEGLAALAAAVAAHDVLLALLPRQQAALRVALDAVLLDAGPGAATDGARQAGAPPPLPPCSHDVRRTAATPARSTSPARARASTATRPASSSSPRRTGARCSRSR
jgi:hypothetical protein